MKTNIHELALLGGKKEFEDVLPVGQINIPSWDDFTGMAKGIFDRCSYTNHGILAEEFESELCSLLGVKNAVAVTNATIGLILSLLSLNLPKGARVLVPAYTFAATVQAVTWAGLEPVFCDVDEKTHLISVNTVKPCIKNVSAVLGVHLWGNICDVEGLEALTEQYGIPLIFDAAHAIGNVYKGTKAGNFGLAEVFSFHATKILSCTEGGAVTTNNDVIAERLRDLRSSYGRHDNMPISVHCNGRFSEFQAGMGLLSLKDFDANCLLNKEKLDLYTQYFTQIEGIHVMPFNTEKSNYQYFVLEIDEETFGMNRDTFVDILQAENVYCRRYFTPGMHRSFPYINDFPQYVNALPVTDKLSKKVMQLPSGQKVSFEDIKRVCVLIKFIHENAASIKAQI